MYLSLFLPLGDDVDDDHKIDGIDDDNKNDRSHKIALGGEVIVEYTFGGTTLQTSATVPVEKILTIPTIYILRDHNAQAVTTQAAVEADVSWANERYAQAGVRIEVDNIQAINSPAGVDLGANGLSVGVGAGVTNEQKALFDAHGTGATDDIVVFYVNTHDPNFTGFQSREGQFPGGYPDPQHMNNITIAAQGGANHGTFTHELLHVLMDSAHDGSTTQYVFYASVAAVNNVNEKRRLTSGHANTVRNSKFVQNP